MNSLCPNGTINLGFVGDYFPIFFKEGTKYEGISMLLFDDVSKMFNCSSLSVVDYHKYTDDEDMNVEGWEYRDNGSLSAIQRDDIVTDITTSTVSDARMRMFHYSMALYIDTYAFYEATNHVTGEAWTPLQFFIVYQPWTLLLIAASLILIRIITSHNKRLNTGVGLWMSGVVSAMFLLSILVLLILHGAVFKGNTIYPSVAAVTSWPDLLVDLLKGKRELFEPIENLQVYKQEQLLGIGKRTTVAGSVEAAIEQMCARPRSTAGMFYEMELDAAQLHGIPRGSCQLQRINPIQGEFSYKYPPTPHIYSYLFSKKTSKKVIKYINYLTLSIYSDDNVESFWTSRLLRSIKEQSTNTPKYNTKQVTVASLGWIFVLLASFHLLSLSSFLCEFLVFHLHKPSIRKR